MLCLLEVAVYWSLFVVLVSVIAAGLWILRGVLGRRRWRRRYQRAATALRRQASQLEQHFLESAAATGKPRGLIWKSSTFHESAQLVRDRVSGDIYALVGITIAFEAVVGGDMEQVAAVSNLRCASALLEWKRNRWTTSGRVLFNLEPDEAIERYSENLDPVCQVVLSGDA